MKAKSLLGYLRKFCLSTAQYRKRNIICAQLPVRLWIEPTNICNLRCIMCPTGRGRLQNPGRMSLDLYRKIIDEAAAFAIDVNLIGRGEAFLHPEIGEMIRYAHQRGLNVRIETNATVLSPEKSEEVIAAGLDFISFSFDGYGKESYEHIRRGASFDATLGNILQFLQVKKRLAAEKPYTVLQFIEMLPFRERATPESERQFKSRFRGLPLNSYRYVTPHRYVGEIEEGLTGTRYGYMKGMKHWRWLRKLKYTPCAYPWFSMHILWDGTVMPCCMDFHSRYVLGNVPESSLREMWNGEAMKALRRKLGSGSFADMPLCSRCDMLHQTTILGISTKNIRDFKIFLQENLLC
ncbi:MAG: radical SAM protein [Candidatus Aureabacteria bacterium]|nr:radical SAM protein [Candidatus Auribacterota bacterium]